MNGHFDGTPEYTKPQDFCSLFQKEMAPLYQLAYLLTADHGIAVHIFVTGIDECTNGNPVFKQWAHSWAKRVIIKNAIRAIAPASFPHNGQVREESVEMQVRPDAPEISVARLARFDRFAFVLAVLEKISVAECAVLLACTRADVLQARARALQALASAESYKYQSEFMRPGAAFATNAA